MRFYFKLNPYGQQWKGQKKATEAAF